MRGKLFHAPDLTILHSYSSFDLRNMTVTTKRNPPFRAEHCGSLLRPEELVQKRYDVAAGKAPASELAPLEDQSIADVIKLQKDCGLHVVSSGEYARSELRGRSLSANLTNMC
jgi:hypothetical protein